MLAEIWLEIRGRRAGAPNPAHLQASLPEEDDADTIRIGDDAPAFGAEQITGFGCIIQYIDSRGRASERRITCSRLMSADGVRYIDGYCHERGAYRKFRIDRIQQVVDLHSGEISDNPPSFFEAFQSDHVQRSRLGWGMSVLQRADLMAALNVLVFMAICDDDWHRAEREVIERFVTRYWLRAEIRHEPPMDEILDYADHLVPDPEAFYVSLSRCHERPQLAGIIRRGVQELIEADGQVHSREFYWGNQIDNYFRQLDS